MGDNVAMETTLHWLPYQPVLQISSERHLHHTMCATKDRSKPKKERERDGEYASTS